MQAHVGQRSKGRGRRGQPAHDRAVAAMAGTTWGRPAASATSNDAPLTEASGAEPPTPDTLTGLDEAVAPARIPEATLDAARAVNRHHADRMAALRERAQSIDT